MQHGGRGPGAVAVDAAALELRSIWSIGRELRVTVLILTRRRTQTGQGHTTIVCGMSDGQGHAPDVRGMSEGTEARAQYAATSMWYISDSPVDCWSRRGSEAVRTCGGTYHYMWHAPRSAQELNEQRSRRYAKVPHKHDN
jgi:hypothetical protein